jgi:hypothetical protein
MCKHGRAGKPKQLARNAKNPGKTFGFTAERTGTEQPTNSLGNSHFDTTRDAKYDARRETGSARDSARATDSGFK